MLILPIYSRPPVSLVRSLSLTVVPSRAPFTMVTPANALVRPCLTFYPPPSPCAIRLSISRTGITLIMIIAVMVMITTAKLHPPPLSLPLSLSHIQHPEGLWLTERPPANVSLAPLCSAAFDLSLFLPSLSIYLAFSRPSRHTQSSLSRRPARLLSLLRLFNFAAVFHLCCCALSNLPRSILPPLHLSSTLLLPQSRFFSLFCCSPSLHPPPLLFACSATTKE